MITSSLLKSTGDSYFCAYANLASRLCVNEKCQIPSICCQDDSCQCNKLHTECTQIRMKPLVDKLRSKIIDYSPFLQKVHQLFDNLIDQISQILEQSEKYIKKYGLRCAEIRFLDCIEQNRTNTLTGKIVSAAEKISKEPYDGDFAQVYLNVEKVWNQTGHLMLTPLFAIKDILQIPTIVNRLDLEVGQKFKQQIIDQFKGKQIFRQGEANSFQQEKQIKSENKEKINILKNYPVEIQNPVQKKSSINSNHNLQIQKKKQVESKTNSFKDIFQLFEKNIKSSDKKPSQSKQQQKVMGLQRVENLNIFEEISFNDYNKIHGLQNPKSLFEGIFGPKQNSQNRVQKMNKAKAEKLQKQDKNASIKQSQKEQSKVLKQKVSRQYLVQTSQHLCQILGIGLNRCIQFVNLNYWKDGKVLDKQAILDLALNSLNI